MLVLRVLLVIKVLLVITAIMDHREQPVPKAQLVLVLKVLLAHRA